MNLLFPKKIRRLSDLKNPKSRVREQHTECEATLKKSFLLPELKGGNYLYKEKKKL